MFAYLCKSFEVLRIELERHCKHNQSIFQDIKGNVAKFHTVKLKHEGKVSEAQMRILKQDAENQHAILSKKASSNDVVSANSMSPHLSMHSTRGQEAGRGRHLKVQAVSTEIL